MYMSLAVLGLCYGALAFSNCRATLAAAHRLLNAVASLVAEHRLQGKGASVVAACGLSRFSCGPWSTGPVVLVKGL